MREILFRGKRVDNGEWLYGAYYKQEYVYGDKKEAHCIITTSDVLSNDLWLDYEEVIPETVGQYTGLPDKNGTKIFEGDILKQKTTSEFAKVNPFEWEHYGVVRFGYYDWNKSEAGYSSIGWYIQPLKSISITPKNYLIGNIRPGLNQCYINDNCHPIEVIGNIHDNYELKKQGTSFVLFCAILGVDV